MAPNFTYLEWLNYHTLMLKMVLFDQQPQRKMSDWGMEAHRLVIYLVKWRSYQVERLLVFFFAWSFFGITLTIYYKKDLGWIALKVTFKLSPFSHQWTVKWRIWLNHSKCHFQGQKGQVWLIFTYFSILISSIEMMPEYFQGQKGPIWTFVIY